MLHKNKVLETVSTLEDEFTMYDLFEKLIIIEKIEKGLEQGKNGDFVKERELKNITKEWSK